MDKRNLFRLFLYFAIFYKYIVVTYGIVRRLILKKIQPQLYNYLCLNRYTLIFENL